MTYAVHEQAEVLQVNDASGELFNLVRQTDGSIVAINPRLYANPLPQFFQQGQELDPAAIGEIRRTDVLTLDLNHLTTAGGAIATSPTQCPAGYPALASFAQILRRGAKDLLDIDESELQVGLQSVKYGDLVSKRVFIADALDNGAGYAVEIGQESELEQLLTRTELDFQMSFGNERHRLDCTSSCPRCLRNYENRFLHWALDWRLALDAIALALGRPMNPHGWNDRAHQLAAHFIDAYQPHSPLNLLEQDGFPVVVAGNGSAVVLGHPLLRRDTAGLSAAQMTARDALLASDAARRVVFADPYVLDRVPDRVFADLVSV